MMFKIAMIILMLTGIAFTDVAVFQPDGVMGKDSYTSEVQHGANYGDADTLECGFVAGGQRVIFIEFVELDDPQYENVTVNSAYLSLYIRYTGAFDQMKLGAVTTFWDEMVINWDNMPPSVLERTIDTPVGTGWVNYEVTDIVQAWLDGTLDHHGICFWGDGLVPWFSAVSSDDAVSSDLRPKLIMTYTGTSLDQSTWAAVKNSF